MSSYNFPSCIPSLFVCAILMLLWWLCDSVNGVNGVNVESSSTAPSYWFQDTSYNPLYHNQLLAHLALNCVPKLRMTYFITNPHTGIHIRMYELDKYNFVAVDVEQSLLSELIKGRCNETITLSSSSVSVSSACINHVIWRVWRSVQADFDTTVRENKLLQRQFYLTGHSMGGSVATLVGAHLIQIRNKSVHSIVTFGSPPIANALLYRWLVQYTFIKLFVNEEDPVPRLMSPIYFQPIELEDHIQPIQSTAHIVQHLVKRNVRNIDSKQLLISQHLTYFGLQRCL